MSTEPVDANISANVSASTSTSADANTARASLPSAAGVRSGTRLPFLTWLRPAEWTVVLFVGYMLFRMALEGFGYFESVLPRGDMICALMLAVFGKQVWRYRKMPWPEESELSRPHWMLLPVMLIPLAVEVWAVLQQSDWGIEAAGGVLSEAMFIVHWLLLRFSFLGLPPLLLWLSLGLHVKTHDQLQGRVFLKEVASGLGSSLRDWAPPVLLTLFYGMLGSVLDHSGIPDQDDRLRAIDQAIFLGHDPVQALQQIVNRPLLEWTTFCYAFYAPLYPLVFGLLFAKEDRSGFRELALAVTLGLALGFLGYTIVPAMGPAFTEKFAVDVKAFYFQWARDELMDKFRVPRDCFPSLHTCMSLVFLWGAYRHMKKLYWVLLPIVVTIPFACVFLRYHYFVDLVAGALLFLFVRWATLRLCRWYESARPATPLGAAK